MPRRGANGRWITEDSQEARDQQLVELIISWVFTFAFIAFLVYHTVECGGPGWPLCK